MIDIAQAIKKVFDGTPALQGFFGYLTTISGDPPDDQPRPFCILRLGDEEIVTEAFRARIVRRSVSFLCATTKLEALADATQAIDEVFDDREPARIVLGDGCTMIYMGRVSADAEDMEEIAHGRTLNYQITYQVPRTRR